MKADDIPFLIRDVKNEMPYHNDVMGKIPVTFNPLPKSFMEKSHQVDNKFLNNHLGEIEEAVHKKLINKIPFIQQQKKYHKESGILNHDNFFHADLATGCPISDDNFKHSQVVINAYRFVEPCTHGSEVQVDGSPSTTNHSVNTLYAYYITAAEAGKCYDSIAQETVGTPYGNGRMGMYIAATTGAARPLALIIDQGTSPNTAGYTYHVGAEWTQDSTTNVWVAHNDDNTLNTRVEMTSGQRHYIPETFGALPDPFTAGSTLDTYPAKMKITHS